MKKWTRKIAWKKFIAAVTVVTVMLGQWSFMTGRPGDGTVVWAQEQESLLKPGVKKLPADTVKYQSFYECRQIPSEAQEGIYFLNDSVLSFYSFAEEETVVVKTFAQVRDSFVAADRLYVLENQYTAGVGYSSVIQVYNLDRMEEEKTILLDFSASVIGADGQGRMYLAGGDGQDTMVYLLSADGVLLSETSAVDTIYDFIGFDDATGNFYFECYYNWIYWGYDHDMRAVGAGNVSGNTVTVSKFILQTISQMYFSDRQRAADLLGGKYLCVDSPLYATGNLMNPSVSALFVWDSSQSRVTEGEAEHAATVSKSYADYDELHRYDSVGSRCVYNEKNDSVIICADNDSIAEFDFEKEAFVGTYKTAHPVFSLERYRDYVLAIEKEEDEYYLECMEWRTADALEIHADSYAMQTGTSMQLSVESNGTLEESYIWESSDTKVASVTGSGKVSAWHEGTAEITVKSLSGLSASCVIHVTNAGGEKNFQQELLLSGAKSNNCSNNNYTIRAGVVNSYLMENADGTLTRVEDINGSVLVETYEKENGNLLNTKTLASELAMFGGFYSGTDANYLVFGQTNEQEQDSAEVMRIVKYSRDWDRLSAVSINGANTYIPFDAGSLRMAETDGRLYIHTCHEMYMSDDGLHHQANMTFVINKQSMEVEDSMYEVGNLAQTGYVSHSFNQFIQTDGEFIYRADHGDAYPRAVTLTRCKDGESIERVSYAQPFKISGAAGDNWTGVSIGSLQIGSENCLIAGNSVLQKENNGGEQKNIFVTVTNKDSFQTKEVWFTDYRDGTVEVRTPQMVKAGEDLFLLMWEEKNLSTGSIFTKIVTIDGNGNRTSDTVTTSMRLSDCQPVMTSDGLVKWYAGDGSKVTLYAVNPLALKQAVSKVRGDVNGNGKVDLLDAQLVLKAALNLIAQTQEDKLASDVGGDGKVGLDDAQLILKAALNLISL